MLAIDLSQWLFQNARESNVNIVDVVAVDVAAAGAEFDAIAQLIVDGSILRIDDPSGLG